MHYTSHLLIMLLVNLSVVSAQKNQSFYRVNFNVDEAKLDPEDKLVLDKIHADYLKGNYGEIILTAHTDADATDTYNMTLSQRRADVVTSYLSEKGIQRNRVSVKWFGERKPDKSNNSTEGKAINRRVDITLKGYKIENSGELIQLVSPEYKQSYTINPTKENTIKGTHGTTVSIPKNALQTKAGKPVTADQVQIVLEEFLQPKDAAFNQLSTVSDGRMLESGGMFSIKAYAQDEEVILKKGKQMHVEMPTINMQKGMELFTAVKNENGITEWKPASVPFTPKPVKPDPILFTTLDTKYLRGLIVDQPEFDVEKMEHVYEVPDMPKAPRPLQPKPVLIVPTKQSEFAWYERVFIPWFILDKKIAAEYERREKIYHNKMSRYNRQLAIYETAYEKYFIDSTEFERSTLTTMQNWLRKQRESYSAYVQYLETKQWNHALGQLIYLSENDQLTDRNPEDLFIRYVKGNGAHSAEREKYIQAIYRIDFLLTQSMTHIVQDQTTSGVLLPLGDKVSLYASFDFKNTVIEQQLANNPALPKMLQAAQLDLKRQRQKAGLTDDIQVSTSYTTTLTEFGLFNCDRFRNFPPAQMVTVTVPYTGEAKVSFYVAGTNSFMYGNKTENGYSVSLPKGLPIKVVFVAFTESNGPLLNIQQTTLTANTTLPVEPKNVTLDELQKELASL
jgi:hypothetical protein